jgi:putative colanic acid biosynthesis acetyltransferase WcaF
MSTQKPRERYQTKEQATAYTSPWSIRARLGMLLFRLTWLVFCRLSPKAFKGWRLLVLKCFGAKISGRPFVAPSCIIKIPWLLELEDHACLAPQSEVYNLGPITLRARSTVAQYAYLCAGTHDFTLKSLPLIVAPIEIQEDAFVGAKAFVMPGVIIGRGALVGAGSVVTRDVEEWTIVAGNPAKVVAQRNFEDCNDG